MSWAEFNSVQMLGALLYAGAGSLILVGLFAMVTRHHVMRILYGLVLVESGINLFLVAVGFVPDAAAPILTGGKPVGPMVDPLPQALVLTSIVIGAGVLALALALVIKVYAATGKLDVRTVSALAQSDRGETMEDAPPSLPEARS